jgi:hypothetical protein
MAIPKLIPGKLCAIWTAYDFNKIAFLNKEAFLMEMQEPLADNIVLNASRGIGGSQYVSMDAVLSSLGIASAAQLAQLVHLVVQAAEQAGFEVSLGIFGTITKDNTVLQLRDMVLTAVSPPKKCGLGHIVGRGQTQCDFGHPAQP